MFWIEIIQLPALIQMLITLNLFLGNLLTVSITLDNLNLHYRIRISIGLPGVDPSAKQSISTSESHKCTLQDKVKNILCCLLTFI